MCNILETNTISEHASWSGTGFEERGKVYVSCTKSNFLEG